MNFFEFFMQTIVAAIISSLVVLAVTNYHINKKEKLNLISELMGYSYELSEGKDHDNIVYLLNKSYIVFHKHPEVLIKLDKFKNHISDIGYVDLLKCMMMSIDSYNGLITDETLIKPFK